MSQHIAVSKLHLRGSRILVKTYLRPETSNTGLIIIPLSAREDKSWTLWEVVTSTAAADEELNITLQPGDILKTKVGSPVDSGLLDEEDSRRLFFLTPDRAMHVIPCTWEEEE